MRWIIYGILTFLAVVVMTPTLLKLGKALRDYFMEDKKDEHGN